MKKMIFAAMAALLVCSLAACGKDAGSGETTPKQEAESTAPETTPETEPETIPETEPETEPADEGTYEAGVWENDVYTNTSLGMTFELPEGWAYGTAEDIAQIQSQGQEVTGMSDEDLAASEETTVYDLYIYNPTTQSQIMMMGEDLSEYGKITPQQYADMLTAQLTSYEDQGMTYDISESKNMTIGAAEFVTFSSTASYQGAEIYQFYAITKKGDHIISMIVSAAPGEGADECNAVISSIKPVE